MDRDSWIPRVFAGYLFAVDYRDRRGHAFMLQDQQVTKRNVPGEGKQSGNCLHCHASVMPLYRKLGAQALPEGTEAEQAQRGLERVGAMEYWEAHKLLSQTTGGPHPVSCVDCHDPSSMELRVTRPGFIAGIQRLAASAAAVPHLPSIERWRQGNREQPYDPNTDGTRQEMRSFVCGQCHVEYYCGKGVTLFFPWDRGLLVEQIEQTYDEMMVKGHRFKDWVHAETGMEVLKAQHPEFEVWSQGVHARSGVACADCHMPYKREGALKVSDHWVRSPLLQINRACETCHPYGEQELTSRAVAIQDRHHALLTRAAAAAVDMLDALVALRRLHDERNREQASAQARTALDSAPDFAALPDQEKEQRRKRKPGVACWPSGRVPWPAILSSGNWASSNARLSGDSTSSPRRTPWGSTPRKNWRASLVSRLTSPVRPRPRPLPSSGEASRLPLRQNPPPRPRASRPQTAPRLH